MPPSNYTFRSPSKGLMWGGRGLLALLPERNLRSVGWCWVALSGGSRSLRSLHHRLISCEPPARPSRGCAVSAADVSQVFAGRSGGDSGAGRRAAAARSGSSTSEGFRSLRDFYHRLPSFEPAACPSRGCAVSAADVSQVFAGRSGGDSGAGRRSAAARSGSSTSEPNGSERVPPSWTLFRLAALDFLSSFFTTCPP